MEKEEEKEKEIIFLNHKLFKNDWVTFEVGTLQTKWGNKVNRTNVKINIETNVNRGD